MASFYAETGYCGLIRKSVAFLYLTTIASSRKANTHTLSLSPVPTCLILHRCPLLTNKSLKLRAKRCKRSQNRDSTWVGYYSSAFFFFLPPDNMQELAGYVLSYVWDRTQKVLSETLVNLSLSLSPSSVITISESESQASNKSSILLTEAF